MRVLIVMQGANFFRNLEPLVRELDARAHAIVVLHPNRHDDAGVDDARLRAKLARKHERKRERSKQKFTLMERSIEVARADIPRVVIDYRPEPTERWHRRLREGRKVVNLSIYLRKDHPAPERLAEGLEKMLSPKAQRLLRLQLARTLLARRSILRFWRWVEGASPPSRTVLDVLAKFRPDVVLVSPTIAAKNPVEADYIRGARSLGIPTLGYVNSWDNLTSKGTVHLVPDALVVWNEAIAREAVEIHDIPRAAVRITGAPHFDYFFDMRPTRNRAGVRQQMGCEGDTPYVVYLCSSRTIIASEVNIVTALAGALADRFPGAPPTLVVRPHPVNATVWDDYVHAGVVVHPKGGDQADSPGAWQEYYDQLSAASCFVGLNTSAFLEAAVVDRPCLTIVSGELHHAQGRTGHFRHLLDGGFLEVSDDVVGVVDRVERILDGADENGAKRREFVKRFLRPCGPDESATHVLADTIETISREAASARSGRFGVAGSVRRRRRRALPSSRGI